jgi:hypothetical protein
VALPAALAAGRPFRTAQGNLLLHKGCLKVSKICADIKLIFNSLGVFTLTDEAFTLMFINYQQISIKINTTINCNLFFKSYIIIFEQRKNANGTFALFLCHW